MPRALSVIRASGLDWTVVRVTRLSDRPGTGRVHGGAPRLEPIRSIPRADVARFVLEQVTDEALSAGAHGGAAPRQ